MPLVDLSRPLATGLPVFPGDPPVAFSDCSPGAAVEGHAALRLGSHSGTHIDAAAHFVPGGTHHRRLRSGALRARVRPVAHVQAGRRAGASPGTTSPRRCRGVARGGGLLLQTGWDAHFGHEQGACARSLADAAQRLVAARRRPVGTDAFNVDASHGRSATSVHAVLLGADVLIVENLTNLRDAARGKLYQCAFVPLKLAGWRRLAHPGLRLDPLWAGRWAFRDRPLTSVSAADLHRGSVASPTIIFSFRGFDPWLRAS